MSEEHDDAFLDEDFGDGPEDETSESKTIPKPRFDEVIGERNDARQKLEEVQGKVQQYDQLWSNPAVQNAVQAVLNGESQPSQQAAPAETQEELDPYDKKSMGNFISGVVSEILDKKVTPLQSTMNDWMLDREVQTAQSVLGNQFDWGRDGNEIQQKMQIVPGLRVHEAATLVYQDRARNDPTASSGTEAPLPSVSAAAQAVTSTQPTGLTSQERYVAQRMGLSEKDYVASREKSAKEAETRQLKMGMRMGG